MIQSVIFDLDGLLIDSEAVSYKIYQEWMKKIWLWFSDRLLCAESVRQILRT